MSCSKNSLSRLRPSVIILGCHAIFQQLYGSRVWHGGLGYFGEERVLEEHVRKWLEFAESLGFELRVPSGGRTRPKLAPLVSNSEGGGIVQYLESIGISGSRSGQLIPEEYARDSCENVFFSILLSYAQTGCWPTRVGVVSFGFKKLRFEVVGAALGVKIEFFDGGAPPPDQFFNSAAGEIGFLNSIVKPGNSGFCIQDPLLRGDIFREKRQGRMPGSFGRDNSKYIEELKRRLGNRICSEALDRFEALKPGDPLVRDWPWL